MDVLSDILQHLHLKSGLFCRSEVTAPWGLGFAPSGIAMFHIVYQGSCWLRMYDGTPPIQMRANDLVVVPHGYGHQLSDHPAAEIEPFIHVGRDMPLSCPTLRHGGGGPATTLLCGIFRFDRTIHPLLDLLPPLIHINGDLGQTVPWFAATLQFLAHETTLERPGTETMVHRLSDIVFLQVLRLWVEQEHRAQRGWLAALSDPQISMALGYMHRFPEQPWTVASLASKVAMSRSGFAARFTTLVGEAPLSYLTRWRVAKAASLLQDAPISLAELASKVGYESESALSKAFKRQVGWSPAAYRKHMRQPVAER